ncbi:hypothetical protein GQX74_010192 [Glossina fuscipes]|nr:hypothetical protein GQX74_010192 [Glossina fuscipes]
MNFPNGNSTNFVKPRQHKFSMDDWQAEYPIYRELNDGDVQCELRLQIKSSIMFVLTVSCSSCKNLILKHFLAGILAVKISRVINLYVFNNLGEIGLIIVMVMVWLMYCTELCGLHPNRFEKTTYLEIKQFSIYVCHDFFHHFHYSSLLTKMKKEKPPSQSYNP